MSNRFLKKKVSPFLKHKSLSDSPRGKMQEKTFKNWANIHLNKRNKHLEDFESDFMTGELLLILVEELSGQKCSARLKFNTTAKFICLNNLTVVFDFLKKVQSSKRTLVNIGAEDIYGQNKKLILAVIWHLILEWHVSVDEFEDGNSRKLKPQEVILNWCFKELKNYPELELENKTFLEIFSNPYVYFYLIKNEFPRRTPKNLKSTKKINQLLEVFDLAKKFMGIPTIVEPEIIANRKVDDRSLLTLASFYRNYSIKQRKLDLIRPSVPLKLRVKTQSGNFVVTWKIPEERSEIVDYYELYFEPQLSEGDHDGTVTEELHCIHVAKKTSLQVANISDGLEFEIYIRAHSEKGFSRYSLEEDLLVGGIPRPRQVSMIRIKSRTRKSCLIVWNPPRRRKKKIDHYQVRLFIINSKDQIIEKTRTQFEVQKNEINIKTLVNSQNYMMHIRVHSSGGYARSWSKFRIEKQPELGENEIETESESEPETEEEEYVQDLSEIKINLFEQLFENKINNCMILINSGANFKKTDNLGRSLLIYTCLKGELPITKLLLEKGANTNHQDNNGMSAVHSFVLCKQFIPEMLDYLIEFGANVNLKDKSDRTPIDLAISSRQINKIKLLYKYGAIFSNNTKNSKINFSDFFSKKNFTLLDYILQKKTRMALNILKLEKDFEQFDQTNRSLLIYSCLKGELSITKLLLEKGANTNHQDNNGMSAVHSFVLCKQFIPKMLDYLIEFGANVNLKDKSDRTPIHLAISSKQIKKAILLYKYGAIFGENYNDLFQNLLLKNNSIQVSTQKNFPIQPQNI
ncbi:ankyrin repeat-containing protein [Anaeramoeba flamelloides]|uniref:Ankyrin repeat-containing protein n=1 Tax=Anaeramoeba flamelloides TaxID=1746091 RepID=A0ABQ8X8K9_9EUKA|nr:ankyrin repeat-containing protein [Anaeramoeba flamelloides]